MAPTPVGPPRLHLFRPLRRLALPVGQAPMNIAALAAPQQQQQQQQAHAATADKLPPGIGGRHARAAAKQPAAEYEIGVRYSKGARAAIWNSRHNGSTAPQTARARYHSAAFEKGS